MLPLAINITVLKKLRRKYFYTVAALPATLMLSVFPLVILLAEWLSDTAQMTGVPQGRIVREQLERARTSEKRPFLRLAGAVNGPRDLSSRKGFSRP